MSDPTFDALVSGFGNQGVKALQSALTNSWNLLSDDEKKDATSFLYAFVKLHLLDVMGQPVQAELAIAKVTFEQWSALGKQVVASEIKTVLSAMFGLAGSFAGSALAGFIKGIK